MNTILRKSSNKVEDIPKDEALPNIANQYFIVTDMCNIQCPYCWYTTSIFQRKNCHINTKVLDNWLSACSLSEKIRSITFTGGEPLLHPDFKSLLDIALRYSPNVIICTNGTLINDKWAELLLSLNVEIHVSLNGLSKQGNNYSPILHSAILSALEMLAAGNTRRCKLITVVTKENWNEIDNIVNYAWERGFRIDLHPAAVIETHESSLSQLNVVERYKLYESLKRWAVGERREYLMKLFVATLLKIKIPKMSFCTFALSSLVADSDGSAYVCFQKRKNSIGNIRSYTVKEILAKKRSLFKYKKLGMCFSSDCLGMF